MSIDSSVVVVAYQGAYYTKMVYGTSNLVANNANFLQSIVNTGLEYSDFKEAFAKAIEIDKKYHTENGILEICLEGIFNEPVSINELPSIEVVDKGFESLTSLTIG